MSHVDDGALHAYLDGALDSLPGAEADRIRSHLESCEACSRRLEEERRLRAEASTILAGAVTGVGDMPPFEELRARAAAREQTRRPGTGRLVRLAWAASLVIGLGSGWMLRGMSVPPNAPSSRVGSLDEGFRDQAEPRSSQVGIPAEAAPAAQAGAPVVGATEVGAGFAETSEAERQKARMDEEDPTAGDRDVMELDALVRSASRAAPEENEDRSQERVAGDTAPSRLRPRTEAIPMVRTDSAGQRVGEEIRPVVSADLAGVAQRRAEAVSPLLRDQDPAVPGAERFLGRSAEEKEEEGTLVVPGLPVVSVAWLEGPEAEGVVRVIQLLESGDTLEIVHVPAGTDPSVLAPVRDGRTQLVGPRGGGWVVVRAGASRAVLQAVLERMTGGP